MTIPVFDDWQIIHTPGHTDGDIAAFHIPSKRVYIADLMRDLITTKDANKVLKTYYYVHGHLHPKLEKDKEHLKTDLNFYDKNTKKEVS